MLIFFPPVIRSQCFSENVKEGLVNAGEMKRTQSLLDQALKEEQAAKSRSQRLEASMKRRKQVYERLAVEILSVIMIIYVIGSMCLSVWAKELLHSLTPTSYSAYHLYS